MRVKYMKLVYMNTHVNSGVSKKKYRLPFSSFFYGFFFNKLNTRPEMPTNFFLSPFRYEKFEQKEGRLRSCRTRDVTPRLRNPAQDSSN